MSYFIYHGKKIFYREVGEGKPVLFLHGNTASSKMFEFILPLYQADCRVFLMDLLGNGRSDRVEEFPPALWSEWGRQAAALVRHLDMGKVSLVGTSGGAWSAVNAALECPELVEKVVADSFDASEHLRPEFARSVVAEREASFIGGVRARIGSGWSSRIPALWSLVLSSRFPSLQSRSISFAFRSC